MALAVNCPACGEPLDVDEEYRAWRVRCPRCRHEFYPDALRAGADEPRPRRRRPPDDDEVIDRARAVVAGPASWLRVAGLLGALVGVVWVAGAVVLGSWAAQNPAQAKRDFKVQSEEEVVGQAVVLGLGAAASAAVCLLMTYAAVRMGRLDGHGWATAAAVLAICTVLFCLTCVPTGLLGVPLGVWSLVVINSPAVRAGFDLTARRGLHDPGPAGYRDDDTGDGER